jgi:hypothetical protein
MWRRCSLSWRVALLLAPLLSALSIAVSCEHTGLAARRRVRLPFDRQSGMSLLSSGGSEDWEQKVNGGEN